MAPFDVLVESPTITSQYDLFEVCFIIKSKLWTYEKLIMTAAVEASDAFIISGPVNISYDVSPCPSYRVTDNDPYSLTLL